ncbi:MAG: transglycosylase SLT domain-containing protein [Bacteroidia bacterium]
MLNIKKLSLILALFPFVGLQAQSLFEGPDAETRFRIAQIDSNTLKLRNKLYPSVYQGDLNIYGYNEGDVPVFPDSAYAYRLSLLETEIPLEYNQHVRAYIDLYAVRKRKLVSKVLSTSKYYFPIFEEVFDRENIPLEMKYLAVIESALNQNAVSPVGATGMWQFMAPTGRIYGLKTDQAIDERRDIIRSTEAAVRYFKNSYRIYGDWLLVIASYNCGPGNVNKAIRRSGGKKTFWEIMPYLPRETRGYVPAFIAAAYVMNYAAEHNLYPAEEEMYYHMDTVMVDNKVSIEQLALALNVSPAEIKAWNPALKRGYIPFTNNKVVLSLPYAYAVKVAELNNDTNFRNQSTEALTALNQQIEADKKPAGRISYKVKSGETLSKIAKKHDVSVAELKRWNKGKIRHNKVSKGQKLTIYLS